MQILLRSIRLLRHPNVAPAPVPMHHLFYHSRALLSLMAAAPRWWPPALARGVFPLMAAPDPPARRVSRSLHGYRNMASGTGVKGEKLVKQDMRHHIPSANDKRNTTEEILDISDCALDMDTDGEESWLTQIPSHIEDGICPLFILPRSRHRDGSIYRGTEGWKEDYCIADRTETRVEAKKLPDPAGCFLRDDGTCMGHPQCAMLQFFSLKLDKIHVDGGSVELYGYIAARDELDPLLNYVINFSRDDPIVVEQGSLINMTGPKRGIELIGTTFIEYDMRIKTGKQEKDDPQLIDGVSLIDYMGTVHRDIFTRRIHGECGTVLIRASQLDHAVEATIEVLVSEVYSSFSLSLGCFTSGLQEEIRLFDGVIGMSLGLKRFVVAVVMGTSMDLKFKLGPESSIPAEHCCSFMPKQHGCASQEIKTDLAFISVKVTWSTLL